MHSQAFYSVCVPCDVEYDVILKLETHDDDTEFLIRQYNLTELQVNMTFLRMKREDDEERTRMIMKHGHYSRCDCGSIVDFSKMMALPSWQHRR